MDRLLVKLAGNSDSGKRVGGILGGMGLTGAVLGGSYAHNQNAMDAAIDELYRKGSSRRRILAKGNLAARENILRGHERALDLLEKEYKPKELRGIIADYEFRSAHPNFYSVKKKPITQADKKAYQAAVKKHKEYLSKRHNTYPTTQDLLEKRQARAEIQYSNLSDLIGSKVRKTSRKFESMKGGILGAGFGSLMSAGLGYGAGAAGKDYSTGGAVLRAIPAAATGVLGSSMRGKGGAKQMALSGLVGLAAGLGAGEMGRHFGRLTHES